MAEKTACSMGIVLSEHAKMIFDLLEALQMYKGEYWQLGDDIDARIKVKGLCQDLDTGRIAWEGFINELHDNEVLGDLKIDNILKMIVVKDAKEALQAFASFVVNMSPVPAYSNDLLKVLAENQEAMYQFFAFLEVKMRTDNWYEGRE